MVQERLVVMLEPNNIYLGDCLDLMRELPDKSVDAVITDPPYASWDKGHIGMGYSWRRMHEWIAYCPMKAHKLRDMSMGDIIRCGGVQDKQHPTEKPVYAITPLIINSTDPDALILDPFLGSGTTAVACIRTGRRFLGFELDRGYFAIAQRRIRDEQAQYRMNI